MAAKYLPNMRTAIFGRKEKRNFLCKIHQSRQKWFGLVALAAHLLRSEVMNGVRIPPLVGVRVPRGLTLWLLFIADEFRDLFSAFGRSLLTRGAFCRFK